MVKVYPKYKDSGAPWFGEVPSHWQTPRLGSILRERKETNKANDVTKILSVMKDIGVIPYEEKGKVGNKCSEDITRYKIVRPGDIVANCMNIIIGSVGLSKYTGCLSPVYYVLTPRSQEDDSRFFDYVFKIKSFQLSLVRLGNGILAHRMRIPMELLKCETVPKPPAEEQRVIVEYLESFNKIFRRYIREKQKTIKLLNEQKQIIINHAVTKGVNCNVRFIPSGVDWIGDIPEHWEVRPIKQLLSRMDYGTSKNLSHDGNIRVLTMGNIQDGEIILPDHGSLDLVPDNLLLEHLDLLFNRTNSPELVGKVGIFRGTITDNISFASYLVRLRVKLEYNSIWLNFILNSTYFWSYARSQALVSLHQANLNSTRYGRMLLPVPPKLEQIEIADHINNKIEEIHQTITAIDWEITLIREYRVRLISDAVTGKIDVRDIKLPEIEDITESEPIEESEVSEENEDIEEVVNADE